MAYSTTLPKDSLLQAYVADKDHLDVFCASLDDRPDLLTCDIRALADRVLKADVPWVEKLMGLRDAIAKPFGLKTAADMTGGTEQRDVSELEVGDRIGFFKIYAISENEIILGENDWHQDFRISILRVSDADGAKVYAATCCRRHNLAGHAYLALIMPFHKRIVMTFLDRAVSPL
ncbi:conserved hypothetical protein [Roseibium sp. TrichSKD4]|uniref:DUF2867 domain-containing protein n=1 Tax=Roseibium sp. TrichSKD4 TaxID=744980 RepID=UPI0001E577E1|nr:DUF2867 domain-containing protein [Roseibium sp. TrichSKD4]EFO28918.1 conserved hypothetical protein [Roseibium sp. TrichSKD4]